MTTRRSAWLPCFCAAVLLISGCGGGPPEEPAEAIDLEQVDPSGQEVVFWYQHTREREDALKEMFARFNRTNEWGITVRGEYAGGYGDIYNKMRVGMQGGSLPDLVVAYQNQSLEYFRAGGIVDIDPYFESPRWGLSPEAKADFVRAFLRQDRIASGELLALPPNRSIEVLYYNADWLTELGADGPPTTWEEFARLCRSARDQPFSGNESPSRTVGFILDPDASRLASMVFSRGGSLFDDASARYTLNTPEMNAAMTLLKELAAEGAVELIGDDSGDATAFYLAQSLFVIGSTTGLPFFRDGVQAGAGFEWSVSALPHTTPEPVVNVYGASVSIGRTTPERQLAAWLFLRWFTEPEQQAKWVQASNYFPARKSTRALLSDYIQGHPTYGQAYGLLDLGQPEPGVAGYEAVRRKISETVVRVLQGAQVAPALERLEREANATLDVH